GVDRRARLLVGAVACALQVDDGLAGGLRCLDGDGVVSIRLGKMPAPLLKVSTEGRDRLLSGDRGQRSFDLIKLGLNGVAGCEQFACVPRRTIELRWKHERKSLVEALRQVHVPRDF